MHPYRKALPLAQLRILNLANHVKPIINPGQLHTYVPSMLCSGAVVIELGSVGRAVEVQLRVSVVVRLQPSVLSDSGRVIAGGGGYTWAPRPTHRDTTNPDTRPVKAP